MVVHVIGQDERGHQYEWAHTATAGASTRRWGSDTHSPGRAGTVVEVFRVPRESCLVRMDGDPNRRREWFFYRDEMAFDDT